MSGQKKHDRFISRVKRLLIKYRQFAIGLGLGILIVIGILIGLSMGKVKNSTDANPVYNATETAPASELGTKPSDSSPTPEQTQPSVSAPISSNSTSTQTAPSSAPAPNPINEVKKSPFTFTFSSGNRTAQWYAGDTFFPGKGYTDEWVSVTGQADATGLMNMRVSYNCSSGSACPGIILQGRNDDGGWIDYKTLQSPSGTVTYPVLYSYYRLLLSSGGCSSNACPPPTPPFQISYELSANGYFY